MNKPQTVYFIGCGVLGPDIRHIAEKLNLDLIKKFLPGGLHNQPDTLRERLQEAIDEAAQDANCQRIIVGYGLCGKGAVGIHAPGVPLVFPKVHDCISLFLGSDRAYREEFKKYPGTFYLSAGWCAEQTSQGKGASKQIMVGSQAMGCKDITDTYGEEGGKNIIRFFDSWQKNYQRAAFIDTGIGNVRRPAEQAREMADTYQWDYQRIQGNASLMTRLLTSTVSDEEILVVPPLHVTTYSAIENGLASAPQIQPDEHEDSGPRYLVLDKAENKGLSIRYGLGIDAGGTYTDAAIYDFHNTTLPSKNKALTTKWNFSIGIDKALSELDTALLAEVQLVSVSTTLATNAIVENEGQNAGLLLMPAIGNDTGSLITHSPKAILRGRLNISGQEQEPVDHDEIRRVAANMIQQHGVTAFAVSGYAGAMNPIHELEVKKVLQEATGMAVTCGHELSSLLNYVVRAQTAVFNARIIQRMIKFFQELDAVLKNRGIDAPVMVVKGDGTLMSSAMAIERPVETILSGPAASVAGAKVLTGMDNAMVVDIGGTTTDTADLSEGIVDVCYSGARVGGIATHVKALRMQTVGLGGDSHIQVHNDTLRIGPRRVAPLVWADAQMAEGVGEPLSFMESTAKRHPHASMSHIILAAVEGELPFEPTGEESTIYRCLLQRPHALEELAAPLNLLSASHIPTERLEACGLVQRCGLTPTDLLHITGQYRKWPADAARRMAKFMALLWHKEPDEFVSHVLERFVKELARELLKKQLSNHVVMDEEAETQLSKHLIECILSGRQEGYSIKATLEKPIIGIGAPVQYFLPNAGEILNTEVIVPENADVANALGAITSHIMIKRKVLIRPGDMGGFWVEGIAGGKQFTQIDAAEEWAVGQLKDTLQKMGQYAGTSRKTVEMEIKDRIVKIGNGSSLFLDRTILATLSGSPDLVLETAEAR